MHVPTKLNEFLPNEVRTDVRFNRDVENESFVMG